MKALTVWQPWASLIIMGAKPYEFRKWDYRTRAAGHQGFWNWRISTSKHEVADQL